MTTDEKFQVGDRVRVTDYDDGVVKTGDIGIIAKITDTTCPWPYEVEVGDRDMLWLFSADEIEKVAD